MLTKEEALALFRCVYSATDRLMLQLLYGSGLRISEVAKLRVQDIDLQRLAVFVRCGKGKKDCITVLGPGGPAGIPGLLVGRMSK